MHFLNSKPQTLNPDVRLKIQHSKPLLAQTLGVWAKGLSMAKGLLFCGGGWGRCWGTARLGFEIRDAS